MELDIQDYPKNSEYELTELGSETVLVSVVNEKAVYLNQAAQLIWQLCDGKSKVLNIIESIEKQFPGEKKIAPDVLNALDEMREDMVISLTPSPS